MLIVEGAVVFIARPCAIMLNVLKLSVIVLITVVPIKSSDIF